MTSVLQVIIVAVVLTTAFGQNATLSPVTNGTQDYLTIVQTQMLHQIKISELENDAIDTRFLDRMSVIEAQQQIVLNEIKQINQTVMPWQALNLVRKFCVQKYNSQFMTHQSAKEQMSVCVERAINTGKTLTSDARLSTSSAETYAMVRLPSNLESCKYFGNNTTKIEQCYIDNVQKTVEIVNSKLAMAQAYRDESLLQMNIIVKGAVSCSFAVEKAISQATASTTIKINDCIDSYGRTTYFGDRKALN